MKSKISTIHKKALELWPNSPELNDATGGDLVLKEFLSNLEASENTKALERLCQKVDVPKKLYTSYTSEWKKNKDAKPIASACWPYVITSILNMAIHTSEGKKLKALNSAFNALDLYKKQGGQELLPELEDIAKEMLSQELDS